MNMHVRCLGASGGRQLHPLALLWRKLISQTMKKDMRMYGRFDHSGKSLEAGAVGALIGFMKVKIGPYMKLAPMYHAK